MKTYWLLGNTTEDGLGCPFAEQIRETIVNAKHSPTFYELRSLYSPVSFDDCDLPSRPQSKMRTGVENNDIDVNGAINNYQDMNNLSCSTLENGCKDLSLGDEHPINTHTTTKSHIFRVPTNDKSATCVVL